MKTKNGQVTAGKVAKNTIRLKLDKWDTGDTCPGCLHDGMTFTAQERDKTLSGIEYVRGVLSCPACGWWDDLAFCFEYQIPPEALALPGEKAIRLSW